MILHHKIQIVHTEYYYTNKKLKMHKFKVEGLICTKETLTPNLMLLNSIAESRFKVNWHEAIQVF